MSLWFEQQYSFSSTKTKILSVDWHGSFLVEACGPHGSDSSAVQSKAANA